MGRGKKKGKKNNRDKLIENENIIKGIIMRVDDRVKHKNGRDRIIQLFR